VPVTVTESCPQPSPHCLFPLYVSLAWLLKQLPCLRGVGPQLEWCSLRMGTGEGGVNACCLTRSHLGRVCLSPDETQRGRRGHGTSGPPLLGGEQLASTEQGSHGKQAGREPGTEQRDSPAPSPSPLRHLPPLPLIFPHSACSAFVSPQLPSTRAPSSLVVWKLGGGKGVGGASGGTPVNAQCVP